MPTALLSISDIHHGLFTAPPANIQLSTQNLELSPVSKKGNVSLNRLGFLPGILQQPFPSVGREFSDRTRRSRPI